MACGVSTLLDMLALMVLGPSSDHTIILAVGPSRGVRKRSEERLHIGVVSEMPVCSLRLFAMLGLQFRLNMIEVFLIHIQGEPNKRGRRGADHNCEQNAMND